MSLIWDEDRGSTERVHGAGFLYAFPLALVIWLGIFWCSAKAVDWMTGTTTCGEVTK